MSVLGWYKIEGGRYRRHGNYKTDEPAKGLTGVEFSIKAKNDWIGFWYEPYCGWDDDCHVHLVLWPVSLWLHFPHKGYDEKRWGFTLGGRYWQRWSGVSPDSDDDSRRVFFGWREWLWDTLFGKTVCGTQKGKRGKITVSMPEGDYHGTYEYETRVWVRPRWPFHKIRKSTSVDMPKGIPFMGKGENSWDCDDDGLFGFSGPGHSVEAAAITGRNSVLKSREKYGNPSEYHPDIPAPTVTQGDV